MYHDYIMILTRFWRDQITAFTTVIFMEDNNNKIYKPNVNASAFKNEIKNDIEENVNKFNDPVVLGELVYRLLEERENTNRILKNVLTKLEAIESGGLAKAKEAEVILPEIDEEIMTFTKESGKVTAEDVRNRFNYRGKNAASARLNRLCNVGLLQKKQVGKKVFFFP